LLLPRGRLRRGGASAGSWAFFTKARRSKHSGRLVQPGRGNG